MKGKDFYNRKKKIERAIGLIKELRCFSIVGEESIGKTSFLEYILSKELLRKHEIDIEKYLIVFLNMGRLHKISKEVFINAILTKLKKYVQIETGDKTAFETMESYIENLISGGKNVVIAFDEFENIAPILDEDFSHWLRNIFQMPNVMAITASHKTMKTIENPSGFTSPLFNTFGNLNLGLFEKEESESMITEMFRREEIYLCREEILFLNNLAGGNPYLIQLVGNYYYEAKRKENKIIYRDFRNKMLHQARDQFEWCWENLDDMERGYLEEVRKGKCDSDLQLEYSLKEKGYLIEKDGNACLFSELFLLFIDEKMKLKKMPFSSKLLHLLNKKLEKRFLRFFMIFAAVILAILLYIKFQESDLFIPLLLVIIGGLVAALVGDILRG